MQNLAKQLSVYSPAKYEGHTEFLFHPICNEGGWKTTYESLLYQLLDNPSQRGVAIICGEGNFLSLLPLFKQKGITLLVLADIHPLLHSSNKILLELLSTSQSKDEFILKAKESFSNSKFDKTNIVEKLQLQGIDKKMGKYHFLHDNSRFLECKNAINDIIVCQINYDVFNDKTSKSIADMISKSGATISLFNATNILDYDRGNHMRQSISSLLQGSPNALIAYSTGGEDGGLVPLNSRLSRLDDFVDFMENKRIEHFSQLKEELSLEIDYLIEAVLLHNHITWNTYVLNDETIEYELLYESGKQVTSKDKNIIFSSFYANPDLLLPTELDFLNSIHALEISLKYYKNHETIPRIRLDKHLIEHAERVLKATNVTSDLEQSSSSPKHIVSFSNLPTDTHQNKNQQNNIKKDSNH